MAHFTKITLCRSHLMAGAAAVLLAIGASGEAVAQTTDAASCALMSSNENIRIAVCTSDPGDAGLAAEGARICAEDRTCGVWFYRDADAAPVEAPASHDLMTQEQVTGSMAVYEAVDRILVRIDRNE